MSKTVIVLRARPTFSWYPNKQPWQKWGARSAHRRAYSFHADRVSQQQSSLHACPPNARVTPEGAAPPPALRAGAHGSSGWCLRRPAQSSTAACSIARGACHGGKARLSRQQCPVGLAAPSNCKAAQHPHAGRLAHLRPEIPLLPITRMPHPSCSSAQCTHWVDWSLGDAKPSLTMPRDPHTTGRQALHECGQQRCCCCCFCWRQPECPPSLHTWVQSLTIALPWFLLAGSRCTAMWSGRALQQGPRWNLAVVRHGAKLRAGFALGESPCPTCVPPVS